MSRTIRKQLFCLIDSLLKVDQLLQKLINNPESQQLMQLLPECQEGALAIGNQIEKVYGEGTQAVHELEDYCEAVYQMSQTISVSDRSKCYQQSKEHLYNAKKKMEQEIPDKLEVVFLPYKASMWDSLESVWFAARDDDDCDDFVIPIPYYDKNPDGSFREEHWEGNEYPDYVPITRYDAYDFEARKPDMIFIHNPYDEGNYVTSVHPFFYSKNIKQFTNRLVYIPYFVLNEIDPNDKVAVDNMRHFVETPAVFNADKIFVQSEAMKQVYVNVITELIGDNEKNRKFLNEKISGAGSPKIDKVLNTKKEDLDIPEEWRKIIEKPDGSWKKIVFYNTSVSALLQYDEMMLRKMEDVFDTFKNKSDDVALLWRPHPLIKATIESMRPELQKKYEKIEEQYIEEGWGIYDDSADVDRAVVLCDAYYGDQSSVISLAKKLTKPILIQMI